MHIVALITELENTAIGAEVLVPWNLLLQAFNNIITGMVLLTREWRNDPRVVSHHEQQLRAALCAAV